MSEIIELKNVHNVDLDIENNKLFIEIYKDEGIEIDITEEEKKSLVAMFYQGKIDDFKETLNGVSKSFESIDDYKGLD